jgi:flagellar motor switch protein FliN/FliY
LNNDKKNTLPSRKEPDLSQTGKKVTANHPNLDLILDIPLILTVNLGEVEKPIKEVLALNTGTIVEMNRLAGNPVDILLNGKLIAHGEVVVIEENFAVRVSYILSPGERVRRMV